MTHDEAVKRAKKIVLKHLPAPKDYITSPLEEDFVKELQQAYRNGMNSSLAHIKELENKLDEALHHMDYIKELSKK